MYHSSDPNMRLSTIYHAGSRCVAPACSSDFYVILFLKSLGPNIISLSLFSGDLGHVSSEPDIHGSTTYAINRPHPILSERGWTRLPICGVVVGLCSLLQKRNACVRVRFADQINKPNQANRIESPRERETRNTEIVVMLLHRCDKVRSHSRLHKLRAQQRRFEFTNICRL